MKILIELESDCYTDKQRKYCSDNKIEIEWDLPFLPNRGDSFDCNSIIGKDKMPDFDKNLYWFINSIEFERINGEIIPILCIGGE